ncbi:MAG: response regulator [Chloroflexota bacterium]
MTKILIIDDDNLLRNLFTKRLEHVGYEVATASDGEVGLEVAAEFLPDVILLDYQMPKLNGDEVMGILSETDWGADIPIIVMSAISTLADITNLDHAKLIMYKPITNRELLEAIEVVLESIA